MSDFMLTLRLIRGGGRRGWLRLLLIRVALNYAAEFADEVRAQIHRNEEMIKSSRSNVERREVLLRRGGS